MRRDTFLKSLAALAAAGALPLSGLAAANLKMMIPPTRAAAGTSPAARWARRCRRPARRPVTYDNKGGAPAPWAWRSSSTPARATRTR